MAGRNLRCSLPTVNAANMSTSFVSLCMKGLITHLLVCEKTDKTMRTTETPEMMEKIVTSAARSITSIYKNSTTDELRSTVQELTGSIISREVEEKIASKLREYMYSTNGNDVHNKRKRVMLNALSRDKRLKNTKAFDELFCLAFDSDAE
ncbi:hypothetical protein D915_008757 [Fasciola hepatica]|uniref:Uncharacterized protein n=1 Tax=Fasciola hepatica TaxID=6192 RepID=A0A4E0RXL4_FASHE|nr:hypothetical protein D915_008757 [Fasciola hepatica]